MPYKLPRTYERILGMKMVLARSMFIHMGDLGAWVFFPYSDRPVKQCGKIITLYHHSYCDAQM